MSIDKAEKFWKYIWSFPENNVIIKTNLIHIKEVAMSEKTKFYLVREEILPEAIKKDHPG
jgi:hypothetical protein